jgi:hypothetical protein
MTRPRRLVITVCPYEPGVAVLPVERGGRARRLDARAVGRELQALVERRGLGGRVRVREGCAGGCHGTGPNVGVTMYPLPAPGEPEDSIAVGWRSYVGALGTLACLASIIEENLSEPTGVPPRRRGAR